MSYVKLSVFINGKEVTKYDHDGKVFIEGRKGSEYEIVVDNLTSLNKKVVISVDGLNIISGDKKWEQGYVIKPYARIKIPGWLKDNSTAAKFEFSSKKDSYNSKNDEGQSTSIGVIGCLVYDEDITNKYRSIQISAQPYNYNNPNSMLFGASLNASSLTASASSTSMYDTTTRRVKGVAKGLESASASVNNVGTGHGDKTSFKTTQVDYDFYTTPSNRLTVYYDDASGLEARGIIVKKEKVFVDPDPFPGYGSFCPDPK